MNLSSTHNINEGYYLLSSYAVVFSVSPVLHVPFANTLAMNDSYFRNYSVHRQQSVASKDVIFTSLPFNSLNFLLFPLYPLIITAAVRSRRPLSIHFLTKQFLQYIFHSQGLLAARIQNFRTGPGNTPLQLLLLSIFFF